MGEAETQTDGIFLWCTGWFGSNKEDDLTQNGRVREYFLDEAVLKLSLGL